MLSETIFLPYQLLNIPVISSKSKMLKLFCFIKHIVFYYNLHIFLLGVLVIRGKY